MRGRTRAVVCAVLVRGGEEIAEHRDHREPGPSIRERVDGRPDSFLVVVGTQPRKRLGEGPVRVVGARLLIGGATGQPQQFSNQLDCAVDVADARQMADQLDHVTPGEAQPKGVPHGVQQPLVDRPVVLWWQRCTDLRDRCRHVWIGAGWQPGHDVSDLAANVASDALQVDTLRPRVETRCVLAVLDGRRMIEEMSVTKGDDPRRGGELVEEVAETDLVPRHDDLQSLYVRVRRQFDGQELVQSADPGVEASLEASDEDLEKVGVALDQSAKVVILGSGPRWPPMSDNVEFHRHPEPGDIGAEVELPRDGLRLRRSRAALRWRLEAGG